MMLHDVTSRRSLDLAICPTGPRNSAHRRPRADIVRLLAVEPRDSLIIAVRRHDAPAAPERVAKHGFAGNALRWRVEGRRQLFQGLFPPVRNETPAHWRQFRGATIGELHDIDRIGWSDVVVRLQISSGAREVVEIMDFAPRVALGETSAHGRRLAPGRSTRLRCGTFEVAPGSPFTVSFGG